MVAGFTEGSTHYQCAPVSGGSISDAFHLLSDQGPDYFVKVKEGVRRDFFAAEEQGLHAIRETGVIRVPEVLAVVEQSGHSGIILEYLSLSEPPRDGFSVLGQRLADLHRYSDELPGFHADNFIGASAQRNIKRKPWAEFFVQERLRFQMDLGVKRGAVSESFYDLYASKEDCIVSYLSEVTEPMSLVHGDLWSGNVVWVDSQPALIDPAVYYGHREVDIAFTELFGRFSEEFYRAYNESLPLAPGYKERREIYNLYHLLNHANLFGGHYIDQSERILRTIDS